MKLFRKSKNDTIFPQAPEGKRLYAIGDVHGCKAQMLDLMGKIRQDIECKSGAKNHIVFLGDLIDRGPESAGVVEWVREFCERFPSCHSLMGNHEFYFLKAYDGDSEALDEWMTYGGDETLKSYGIDPFIIGNRDLNQIHAAMKKNIPKTHIAFLSDCPDTIEFGDYLLVHAGIDPLLSIDDQNKEALYWIREPFLSHNKPLEKFIVHGHTVEEQVNRYPHRIAVDTGAYRGGPLSAVCLEDDLIGVLQSSGL